MLTISGTTTTGIVLYNPTLQNPATLIAGAYVTNTTTAHGGDAVYGSAAAAWDLTNAGTIAATGGHGVRFVDGGSIDNSGTILSVGNNAIVLLGTLAGTVTNSGLIESSSTAKAAIYGAAGGIITNAEDATIAGAHTAISFNDTAETTASFGSVDNSGTISSSQSGSGSGVYFGQGGILTNGTSGLITAYNIGVSIKNIAATVVNHGTIVQTGTGTSGRAINFTAGGLLDNDGLVTGAHGGNPAAGYAGSVQAKYAAATIVNTGTITNASNSNGVNLINGGLIVNGATDAAAALIYATHAAIYIGGSQGVETPGATGTVVNYGTLANSATAGSAVLISAGGSVINHNVIAGARTGVSFHDESGTLDNFGVIVSNAPTSLTGGYAVYLQYGGAVTNEAGASIASVRIGIELGGTTTGAVGIVTNLGTVTGGAGIVVGDSNFGRNTIVNAGTVTGTVGIAIELGAGGSQVVIDGGSLLNGAIGYFLPGDSIDLPFLPFAAGGGATVGDGNVLQIVESTGSFGINLDPGQNFAGAPFHAMPDGTGGTLVTEQPTAQDFTRDRMSDILWRSGDGNLALWQMNGLSVAASSIFAYASASWTIRGVADFNGDGRADILWQDQSGNVAGWIMLGATVGASAVVGYADPSVWTIRGTGDFNGDGLSDILWQDTSGDVAIWDVDSNGIGATAIVGVTDPNWHIRGTGDFNGDGIADILFQNDNGSVDIWEMNGFSVAASAIVGFADPSVWTIRGVGDFNGDGKSDILWQDTGGDVDIWEMNGLSQVASAIVGFADPTAWHIAGVGDYNGDGKSDILWQDTSGNVAVWEMNGLSVAAATLVGFADPTAWGIVPSDNTGDTTVAAAPPVPVIPHGAPFG
jgi:hypothetical protein